MCGILSRYLAFHPERTSDQDAASTARFTEFIGPYSAGFVPDPIRIATLAPYGESQRIFDFVKNLNLGIDPQERREPFISLDGPD